MWIQGNLYKDAARWHYAPARIFTGHDYRDAVNNIPVSDYRYLGNTLDWTALSDGDTIYTHTFYADQLAEKLVRTDKRVTVISHNADTPMCINPPDNVIAWYSTNVAIRHERLFSIPIGIENDFWLKDKRRIMENKLKVKKNYKTLVYVNHNIKTNNTKRQKPYDILKDKDWATIHMGSNGQGFDNYINNVYNHPFVVCPEGNGIDTHRIWECLYMNTIPIVIRNINNSFYEDLPILFLDDWEEMNDTLLYTTFMDMAAREWNLEKMYFEYWKKLIYGQ